MIKAWTLIIAALAVSIGVWRCNNPPLEPRLSLALAKGQAQLEQGNYPRARFYYAFALTLAPRNQPATVGLEKARINFFSYTDEISTDQIVLRTKQLSAKYPDDPHVSVFNGDIAYLEARYTTAMAHYRNALRLRPDYPQALFGLAITNEQLGNIDRSLDFYQRAIERSDQNNCYRTMLAENLHQRGQLSAALKRYAQIIANRGSYAVRLAYIALLRTSGQFKQAIEQNDIVLDRIRALKTRPPEVRDRLWVLSHHDDLYLKTYHDKSDYALLSAELTRSLAPAAVAAPERRAAARISPSNRVLAIINRDIEALAENDRFSTVDLKEFRNMFNLGQFRLPQRSTISFRFCGSVYQGVYGRGDAHPIL